MAKGARSAGGGLAEAVSAASTGGGDPSAVGVPEDRVAEPLPISEPTITRRRAANADDVADETRKPKAETTKKKKPTAKAAEPEPVEEDDTPAADDAAEEAPADDDTARGEAEETDGEEGAADDSDDSQAGEDIDADLLRQALDLGYTQADVQELGSNADLRRLIAAEDRRIARQYQAARQVTSAPQGNGHGTPPAQAPAAQATAATVAPKKLELKLTTDNHDPEAIENFKALVADRDEMAQRLAQMEALVGQVVPAVQQIHQDKRVLEFDSAVAALPAEFKPFLGEGESLGFERGSDHFKHRDELFDMADAIQAKAAERGSPISRRKAVEKAAYAKFSDQLESIARTKVRTQFETRRRQQIARPTHRQAPRPTLTVDQELAEHTAEWKKRNRIN